MQSALPLSTLYLSSSMVNYQDLSKAGTLSEFDMALGITQGAVNNGLGVLFQDPLDGKTVIDHTMLLGMPFPTLT